MQTEVKIVPVNARLYPAFYSIVQTTIWGDSMLPITFEEKLWGYVILENEMVIGGWVGKLRGDIPLARMLTKSVYFDSYPVFKSVKKEKQYENGVFPTSLTFSGIRILFKETHPRNAKSSIFINEDGNIIE